MSEHWNQSRIGKVWSLALVALTTSACGGSEVPDRPAGSGAASGSGGTSGGAGAPPITQGIDPGRVGIHRLNNTEYNNTVRDLLEVTSKPADAFLAEEGLHFDNTATALGMTGPQYEAFFNAASALATEVLGNPALLAKIMICTPAAAGDPCITQIAQNFGLRAFRRPLSTEEVTRAVEVFNGELVRSDVNQAVGLMVRAMLASAAFLYRTELDANPASLEAHALSGYELASRLSYLQWSSMPDQALFDMAASGEILQPAALEAQVDRLLADGKADAFIKSFAGQWLDLRKLISHSVTPQVFTTYTAELADAMAAESYAWFAEFLNQDRPLNEWFTADFNYVNDVLAQHYEMTPVSGAALQRVEVPSDQRRGFLGLSAFLTQTSFPSRSSPTLRGVWVISELLCSPPAPPPATVPELADSATPDEAGEADGAENVRERLERHRADPACAGCHAMLDPIGLGLENFDGIGRYRNTYGNGEPINPAGMLPDGTNFNGPDDLATILATDPRFGTCLTSKLFTYALGRDVETYDTPSLDKIAMGWASRGQNIRNLVKEIVVSDAFRYRRGEAP
ncbi:MAG TPA: DUF1592 domain-containing protein [Polyangiaceae bacterium]|nr:DUF1592 domain-containing protein [Polyangiaceae bacterium]